MHAVDVARTHEILARYRPIAPKPAANDGKLPSEEKMNAGRSGTSTTNTTTTPASRPTRTRKRGRGSCASSFAAQKRTCRSTYVPVLPSPNLHQHQHGLPPPSLFRFSPKTCTNPPVKVASGTGGADQEEFLTLSLFPYSSYQQHHHHQKQNQQQQRRSDQQEDAESKTTTTTPPMEKDLLGRLQNYSSKTVIIPLPVRPVGSSVVIGSIKEEETVDNDLSSTTKTPTEVEDDAELDELPVVVSDSHNRVRLANSAYRELVGQPECSWLETMMIVNDSSRRTTTTRRKRISGEVVLEVSDDGGSFPVPVSCNRFSCKVKIEWTTCNGQKKLVSCCCDVTRLFCPSKDYVFSWRFRTVESN